MAKKTKNKVLLGIDVDKISISSIVREYTKVCEIEDVNIINEDIDDIIVKLYKELSI